ncbi:MAG: flagellar biosynthesis protein FlhF [Clostridia bacterium]|jgi:flagellar biosynthesis protein FlhF|nr:flagellar biosynthesis protein FlhF [Clostridia bacterium]
MKIKTYTYRGKTEHEVMTKAKNELGEDAYILTIRKIKPDGIMKFFKKPEVELTAVKKAIKKEPVQEIKKVEEPKVVPTVVKEEPKVEEKLSEVKEEPKKAEEKLEACNTEVMDVKNTVEEKDKVIKSLESKLDNLEGLLTKVMGQITTSQQLIETETKRKYKSTILQLFYDNLVNNEVLPEIAEKLLDGLDDKVVNEGTSINQLVSIVYDRIISFIGKPTPINIDREEGQEFPKTIVFIGPTGVGKTTTIAKVTALFTLNEKKKIGLMTADTYRIAAVEQLKTYAEILGISVEVLYSTNEFDEKFDLFKAYDSVFIDTAGRSHKNEKRFDELKDLLAKIDNKDIYLVLSLATKYRDMVNIVETYSELGDYKIIFTKQDETLTLGSILNIRYLTSKKLSYITFGQNVPDDIEVIQPEKIAKLLLGSFDK